LDRLPICSQLGLSNDVPMSPTKDSDRPSNAAPDRPGEPSANGDGVLSKLPRTRPQRSSPRRAAARAASAGAPAAGATPSSSKAEVASAAPARANGRASARAKSAGARAAKSPAPARGSTTKRPTRATGARASRAAAAASVEPAPRQGFESETERANGTVNPPGGADLVASAAEIVGELAKAGVSKGERLLKDLVSHLPL
jgi:hypothetical protein